MGTLQTVQKTEIIWLYCEAQLKLLNHDVSMFQCISATIVALRFP